MADFCRFVDPKGDVEIQENGAQKRHHMRDSYRNIAAHFTVVSKWCVKSTGTCLNIDFHLFASSRVGYKVG